MSLIDLDQPADRATDSGRRSPFRWRVTSVAVVALLIGAVFGGLVTHRWTVHQRQAADGRTVSVLIFAEQPAGGSAIDIIVNGDGIMQVTFSATIAVINAGPRPVELQRLAAEKPGLLVAGSARSQWISPGTSIQVVAGITANCVARKANGGTRATIGGGTLQATASLRTSSGSVVTVSSLSLDTGPWTTQFQTANNKCLQQT